MAADTSRMYIRLRSEEVYVKVDGVAFYGKLQLEKTLPQQPDVRLYSVTGAAYGEGWLRPQILLPGKWQIRLRIVIDGLIQRFIAVESAIRENAINAKKVSVMFVETAQDAPAKLNGFIDPSYVFNLQKIV